MAALVRYLPAAHGEQDVEAVPLYWPVLQLVQADDSTPVAALVRYLPEAHDEQASPSPLYLPTPHSVQSSTLLWSVASSPVVDLPAGQLKGEIGEGGGAKRQ